MSEYIYFAQVDIPDGPIKIGFTADHPALRLVSLATGCPWPLKLLGWCNGSMTEERLVHGMFADQRMSGEWFSHSQELVDFVERATAHGFEWRDIHAHTGNPFTYIRRIVFGHSQTEFAVLCGATQPTVSRWEAGELAADLGHMALIRKAALERGLDWDDRWFFEIPQAASA